MSLAHEPRSAVKYADHVDATHRLVFSL
jgi:hypothetical protein